MVRIRVRIVGAGDGWIKADLAPFASRVCKVGFVHLLEINLIIELPEYCLFSFLFGLLPLLATLHAHRLDSHPEREGRKARRESGSWSYGISLCIVWGVYILV